MSGQIFQAQYDASLETNAGMLYARTQQGLWLFDIDSDSGNRSDTYVKIYRGNQPTISQLITKLA